MINILGPSTAGKSTIAELLEEHIDRIYSVDFDKVKRQISGYYWKRDRDIAEKIAFDTLSSVAETGLPILILFPPPKEEVTNNRIAEVAKTNGYMLLNIEITAPEEVLIERYHKRLQSVQKSGSKWKFKTLEEFKENLKIPYSRPADTITFDSSQKTPDEIFESIIKRLDVT